MRFAALEPGSEGAFWSMIWLVLLASITLLEGKELIDLLATIPKASLQLELG